MPHGQESPQARGCWAQGWAIFWAGMSLGAWIFDNGVQWYLDHFGISRQKFVETKDEQVKSIIVEIELQLRELSEIAWKHIVQTRIYWCEPEDREPIQSEFDREVDNHYYSMKEKFEAISELLIDA